jgi:starch-binding outer membrane protein, SusD/RagB family
MSKKQLALAFAGVFGTLVTTACDLDVPDLNNPGLGELQDTPTAADVTAACSGLLIGSRRNHANENGYVSQLGILGREALVNDNAEPRYTDEMLKSELSSSSPFGGNFWALPYTNIRLANVILAGIDKVPEFSDAQKAGIRGFAHTMQALDLLEVIVTHDTNGAVIDTDHPLGSPLLPIAEKPDVYAKIASLLDDSVMDLQAGGSSFAFPLSSGYTGFDTPKTFLTFNRALRARVAAYMKDYNTALTALGKSFIDDTSAMINFNTGVYYEYSTKPGDATNGLINPNIFVDPQIDGKRHPDDGGPIDARYSSKTGLNDDMKPVFSKLYSSPSSPVALIRNEELILLKAEALYYTGDVEGALNALNLVRTKSGQLAALTMTFPPPTNDTSKDKDFIDALLYERQYSLLFEGGHRWIDLRRFNRDLPLDNPDDKRNVRYPIPLTECDPRPDDPHCLLGSL